MISRILIKSDLRGRMEHEIVKISAHLLKYGSDCDKDMRLSHKSRRTQDGAQAN